MFETEIKFHQNSVILKPIDPMMIQTQKTKFQSTYSKTRKSTYNNHFAFFMNINKILKLIKTLDLFIVRLTTNRTTDPFKTCRYLIRSPYSPTNFTFSVIV